MNFAKFKVRQMQRQALKQEGGIVVGGVTFELTNIEVAHSSELIIGSAYTCTLEAISGYDLPLVVSVTGTASVCGFKYDYTTGVIYIPSDEVIGNIVITAVAVNDSRNEQAVLEATKITSDTYDGTTTYTGESFILLDIYPCRGSTVTVKFKGTENGEEVTKTVTGDLAIDQYDTGTPCTVFFGTYLGQSDDTTSTSGTITISGACEGYGAGTYKTKTDKGQSINYSGHAITRINQTGRVRHFASSSFRGKSSGRTILDVSNGLGEGLEKIKDYSFYYRNGLGITELPNSVEEIGKYAFYYMDDLTLNKLPNSLNKLDEYAFYYCEALALNSLPTGLTKIPDYCFCGCKNLVLSELPNTITEIGQDAFYQNNNICLTKLPNSLVSIGDNAFYGCGSMAITSLPSSLTSIGEAAFFNCYNVSISTVPENIKVIKNATFSNNANSYIVLPSTIESVHGGAWSNCKLTSITLSNNNFYKVENNTLIEKSSNALVLGAGGIVGVDVIIPSYVTSISDRAFQGRSNLSGEIIIPSSVTTIGENAFSETNVEIKSIPNNITNIGAYAFKSSNLTATSLPDSIVSFGEGAFEYSNIAITTLPSNITTIPSYAFMGCDNITTINIPEGVTEIGGHAFSDCAQLEVILPSTLTTIGTYAFGPKWLGVCSRTFTVLATTPPTVAQGGDLGGTAVTQIIVPKGCGDIYKTATGWSDHADKIVEASA